MIGYEHDTVVCLSVSLSVTMCIVAFKDALGNESSTIVFPGGNFNFLFTSSEFGHFCCRTYLLATNLRNELTGTKSRLQFETVNKSICQCQCQCQKWIYIAHSRKKNLSCAKHTSTAKIKTSSVTVTVHRILHIPHVFGQWVADRRNSNRKSQTCWAGSVERRLDDMLAESRRWRKTVSDIGVL